MEVPAAILLTQKQRRRCYRQHQQYQIAAQHCLSSPSSCQILRLRVVKKGAGKSETVNSRLSEMSKWKAAEEQVLMEHDLLWFLQSWGASSPCLVLLSRRAPAIVQYRVNLYKLLMDAYKRSMKFKCSWSCSCMCAGGGSHMPLLDSGKGGNNTVSHSVWQKPTHDAR